jgi:hypothetical protein
MGKVTTSKTFEQGKEADAPRKNGSAWRVTAILRP